jgi:hypothetical protein
VSGGDWVPIREAGDGRWEVVWNGKVIATRDSRAEAETVLDGWLMAMDEPTGA